MGEVKQAFKFVYTEEDCGETASETDSLGSSSSVTLDGCEANDVSTILPLKNLLHCKVIRKTMSSWEGAKFFSEKAFKSTIDPTVAQFMEMSTPSIIERYTRLHPHTNAKVLSRYLNYMPRYFRWSGADLFPVMTEYGHKKMIVLETNSCASGQKYMPLVSKDQPMGGYRVLLEEFLRIVRQEKAEGSGALAVVFDKNVPEVTGYADTLSALSGEEVYLVEWYMDDVDPPVKFIDEVMYVRDASDLWHPIRAAFRYVTQKPWNRIPLHTKTFIFNPIQACLAGGRNKMLAARAYDILNKELAAAKAGVQIQVPETLLDVSKKDVPRCVAEFEGYAVIKDPYSNCGQGVYTITNEEELNAFMLESHTYDSFIVQSLIGGSPSWSSKTAKDGRMFHRGTVPDDMGESYAFDLRLLCYSDTVHGFRPLGMYSRRARKPLTKDLQNAASSWEMLGTNLSCVSQSAQTGWVSDTERVSYMDTENFPSLGLSLDDITSAFVQTVLCTVAIDRMACRLTKPDGTFDYDLFESLNPDPVLCSQIMH